MKSTTAAQPTPQQSAPERRRQPLRTSPAFFVMAQIPCEVCGGTGEGCEREDLAGRESCHACGGSGHKVRSVPLAEALAELGFSPSSR